MVLIIATISLQQRVRYMSFVYELRIIGVTITCLNGCIFSTVESQMERQFNSSTSSDKFSLDFNLMYSVYSWPNTILPFFGGYISDLLGVKLMGVVFIGLITLGQFIVSIGISIKVSVKPRAVIWTSNFGQFIGLVSLASLHWD